RRVPVHHRAEADAVGNPFGALSQRLVGKQHEQAVRQQCDHDVFQHGLPVQRPRVLEHHAKSLARDLVRGKAGDVFALEHDIARGRAFDAHDRLHRGRFARAIGSNQPKNFSGAQVEAEILDSGQTAEAFCEFADLENRSIAGSLVHHWRPSCERAAPRKPPGKNRTTSSATAETMKVANSPVGRRNSPATTRKIAPSAAPSTVRRPPSTAATMTFTPTAISTTVPTEAVPK